ncbi:MAG: hypothetical protein RIC19_24715 [Phaeodactylibacter sp.]
MRGLLAGAIACYSHQEAIAQALNLDLNLYRAYQLTRHLILDKR